MKSKLHFCRITVLFLSLIMLLSVSRIRHTRAGDDSDITNSVLQGDPGALTTLSASAVCNGDNLEVTISAGDAPFKITSELDDNGLPLTGVGTGTYVIEGPNIWYNLIVAETSGDAEIRRLGRFTCDASGGQPIMMTIPYPDTMEVTGLPSKILDVNLTLTGINSDLESTRVLLISPQGTAIEIIRDRCAYGGNADTFTFDDEAAAPLPIGSTCSNGTYKSSGRYGWYFDFPSPAPPAPWNVPLSVLEGENPNGTWTLYFVEQPIVVYGNLDSWSLDITAADTFPPDLLDVEAVCNGDNLEVTIFGGEGPFNIIDSGSSPHLPINGVGTGTYVIGGPDIWYDLSVVETFGDNQTVNLGQIRCVKESGPGSGGILVAGLADTIVDVNITLNGLGDTMPGKLAAVLSSPKGTQVTFMYEVCGPSYYGGGYVYDFTFDDDVLDYAPIGDACASGTYHPSREGAAEYLNGFAGEDPNGTWHLYFYYTFDSYFPTLEAGYLDSWSLDITAVDSTPTPTTNTLGGSAYCMDETLVVFISNGDGPFNITASAGMNMPVLNTTFGEHHISGPEKWDDVTLTETTGDLESLNLGQFKCRTDERPTLYWPNNQAHTVNHHPTFIYSAVTYANNYRLFIFDDAKAASRTVDIRENTGNVTSYVVQQWLPLGRLFWRVRARTNRVWGLWSSRFTLFIDPVAPIAVNTPVPNGPGDVSTSTPVPSDGPPDMPTFPPPPNSR